ncbi:MAG: hypothetical protein ACK47M_00330 [Caldilinea sp.]
MDSALQVEWAGALGLWTGFIFTLLIFSALLGDHVVARFAQYVLVGAVLGYAVVITWQSILASTLATALRSDPLTSPWNWIPVALAAILAVAGLERIFAQGRARTSHSRWRSALRTLGSIPALLLAAVAAAVALIGGVQGTLAPQFIHAARSGLQWDATPATFATGLLTLVITAAALIFFVVDADRHLVQQPVWVQRLMHGWIWVGQRALWLAAGALFARLFASRLSLLVAELTHWTQVIQSSELGQVLETGWRMVTGG